MHIKSAINGFVVGVILAIGLLVSLDNTSNTQATTIVSKINEPTYSDDDLNCLAENIYFESRGESTAGQLAVGIVTMNRVRSADFPKSVCSVVRQARINSSGQPLRNECQFSWYCDGAPDVIKDQVAWSKSIDIARMILEEKVYDFVDGATYFHTNSVRPRWSAEFISVAHIDNHIFYKH